MIRLLPEAADEARAAYLWYLERSPRVAARFEVELTAAQRRIEETPTLWPQVKHGMRRCLVDGFPYGVVFFEDSAGLLVVAVAHCSRKPGYWKTRLPDGF